MARRTMHLCLQALLLGVVLLGTAREARAEDIVIDEAPRSVASVASVASAASLVAQAREREAGPPRRPQVEKPPVRLGMYVVVRVALVDVVSHPGSGSLKMMLRSRLLGRPIARAPLALGLAWRF